MVGKIYPKNIDTKMLPERVYNNLEKYSDWLD